MSNEIKDEMGLVELDDEGEIVIHPGDCFGWYSHVSSDCLGSCCLRSEWCKSYTLNRANQSEQSMKKNLEEIGQDSDKNIVQKKASKKVMADLGRQAFFDGIVNFVASKVAHDNINYSPNRDNASIKVGGKVIVFLGKKRSQILVKIGGRNKDGAAIKMAIGETMENTQSQVEDFLKDNYRE